MTDDYVDAAKAAHAAASYNLNQYQRMTHDQEVAVWKQAFLEQKASADSRLGAWVTMTAICVLTNLSWAIMWWNR
jgi:hypothetical protein